jgi:tRNA G18 (ribose-2'-O)-methylase SpoU
MPAIRLDSLGDPRLADYRALRDPELLRTRNLFVAEGRLVVERLLAMRRYAIRSLLLSDAAYAALAPSLAQEPQPEAFSPQPPGPSVPPIYLCRRADFFGLTGMDIHRGCLALVERPRLSSVDEIIERAMTVIVLEAVANPDNVGGIFRNAAAFGVDAVLLSPTSSDPLYRKAIRTSMAATLEVPFARVTPWPGGLMALRHRRFEIAALTPREPSLTLDNYAVSPGPRRLALVLGAEGAGLSAEVQSLADVRIRIPVSARVDSLNVTVAAGIALARLGARPGRGGLGGAD